MVWLEVQVIKGGQENNRVQLWYKCEDTIVSQSMWFVPLILKQRGSEKAFTARMELYW